VDVVFHTGERSGAYTSSEAPMQTVMPSARADYQGLAALEMLYHEATHMRVNQRLIDAIDASLRATGRPDDDRLWHAVHFYTVGEAVKQVLPARGIGYVTYADRAGLYAIPAFSPYYPLLASVWQPYLQGKASFQDSTRGLVDALPRPGAL
jgi:hypothetical protein